MDKQEIRIALLETAVSFDTIKERAYWEEVKRQRVEIKRLKKEKEWIINRAAKDMYVYAKNCFMSMDELKESMLNEMEQTLTESNE